MTSDAISIVKMLFNTAYSFFTAFYIPGLNGVTPLGLLLASTMTVIAVRFIKDTLNSGD